MGCEWFLLRIGLYAVSLHLVTKFTRRETQSHLSMGCANRSFRVHFSRLVTLQLDRVMAMPRIPAKKVIFEI